MWGRDLQSGISSPINRSFFNTRMKNGTGLSVFYPKPWLVPVSWYHAGHQHGYFHRHEV